MSLYIAGSAKAWPDASELLSKHKVCPARKLLYADNLHAVQLLLCGNSLSDGI